MEDLLNYFNERVHKILRIPKSMLENNNRLNLDLESEREFERVIERWRNELRNDNNIEIK